MNFAHYLITNGVNTQTVYLLLSLPFAALLVSFLRQFVGIKTFSMYEPLVVSYALYFISDNISNGLKYGLPVIFVAWAVSELTRRALEKSRMHYISKVSFKISIAAVLMLAALSFAAYYDKTGFTNLSPFPIIILIALVETLSLFQIKGGSNKTNIATIETLVVSIAIYALLAADWFEVFLLGNAYAVILPILGNFVVGRWTGLRLSEIARFWGAMKDD
jgi:hypothetical protein